MVAISLALPGFSQLYNKQAWKIPVLYGTVAAGVGVYAWQTKLYRPYKQQYDAFIDHKGKRSDHGTGSQEWKHYEATMNELQAGMIRHNTYRQLAIGFAAASYMYFLIDGTLNYPGVATDVKKATTLAMVFPGAGQIYNKTYWKLPIVVGGFSILGYVVGWNNRGYQRNMRAFNALTDGNDATVDEFTENGNPRSESDLLQMKNSYRRNRDLCLIFLGLFYIMQTIDAHATAHMKAYDVSDNLAASRMQISFEPSMDRFFSHRAGGAVNTYGFSLNMRF